MAPLHLVGVTRSLFFLTRGFLGVFVSGFGARRSFFLVFWCISYPLCCNLTVTIKQTLGLADQRSHASSRVVIGQFRGPYTLLYGPLKFKVGFVDKVFHDLSVSVLKVHLTPNTIFAKMQTWSCSKSNLTFFRDIWIFFEQQYNLKFDMLCLMTEQVRGMGLFLIWR